MRSSFGRGASFDAVCRVYRQITQSPMVPLTKVFAATNLSDFLRSLASRNRHVQKRKSISRTNGELGKPIEQGPSHGEDDLDR